MSRNELRDLVQDNLAEKQDNPTVQYGYLGNQSNVVAVPGKTNYVYVTMADGMVTQAYNVTVPNVARLPVVLGYDPLQRNTGLLKVLSVRNVQRMTVETVATTPNSMPHHATHEWLNPAGGKDPVYVELRQFMPLRPMVVNPYSIYVNRGILKVNGSYQQVGGWAVDIAPYLPQTLDPAVSGSAVQGKYILLSIGLTSGSPMITIGTQKSIYSITTADIPAPAANSLPICAVFTYMRQSQIDEAATKTDLIDLRHDMFYGYTATLHGLADVAISGSQVTGQALVWSGSANKWVPGSVAASGSVLHNSLPDLQGGTAGQYYHLTSAERANIIQASGSATNGYLTSADWLRFNATSGSAGIPEAPTDGKTYGRNNAAWVEVTSGSSGTIISGSGVLTTGSVVSGHIAIFSGSSGNYIMDGGAVPSGGGADILAVQVFS